MDCLSWRNEPAMWSNMQHAVFPSFCSFKHLGRSSAESQFLLRRLQIYSKSCLYKLVAKTLTSLYGCVFFHNAASKRRMLKTKLAGWQNVTENEPAIDAFSSNTNKYIHKTGCVGVHMYIIISFDWQINPEICPDKPNLLSLLLPCFPWHRIRNCGFSVRSPPAAESLSHRPAVSLNLHRKSGNGIEEGSETKHALDQAHTKALRCQTQWGEKPPLFSHGKKTPLCSS